MRRPSLFAVAMLQILFWGGLLALFINPLVGVGMLVGAGILFKICSSALR